MTLKPQVFVKFEKDLLQLYTSLGSMRRLIMWQYFIRMRRKRWTWCLLICSRSSWIHHDLDKRRSISETFLSLFTCHSGHSWGFSGHLWSFHYFGLFVDGSDQRPEFAHFYIYSILIYMSLFQMNSIFVLPQINFSLKCFPTISTSKRFHALMLSHMRYQIRRLRKWLSADSAIVWFFS